MSYTGCSSYHRDSSQARSTPSGVSTGETGQLAQELVTCRPRQPSSGRVGNRSERVADLLEEQPGAEQPGVSRRPVGEAASGRSAWVHTGRHPVDDDWRQRPASASRAARSCRMRSRAVLARGPSGSWLCTRRAHSARDGRRRCGSSVTEARDATSFSTSARNSSRRLPVRSARSRPVHTHRRTVSGVRWARAAASRTSSISTPSTTIMSSYYYTMDGRRDITAAEGRRPALGAPHRPLLRPGA